MEGIKETEDVIKFVSDFAEAIAAAKSDGVINIWDTALAVGLTPSLIGAVKGADRIDDEFKDLNGEERDQLLVEFKNAFLKLVGALT